MKKRRVIISSVLVCVMFFSCIPVVSHAAKYYPFESLAGPDLKVSAVGNSGLRLKWKWSGKNVKVDGYQIYRARKENGKYKKIKTIKNGSVRSWVDRSKKKKNKAYWYQIRAFRQKSSKKTIRCQFSNPKAGAIGVTAPRFLKATGFEKATPIILVWDFPVLRGMDGYQIYKSTKKKGKYKRIATIKKKKRTYYIDKKVAAKKTYYYKVRGYKIKNKKRIYGPFASCTGKALNGEPVAKAQLISQQTGKSNLVLISVTTDSYNDLLKFSNKNVSLSGSINNSSWYAQGAIDSHSKNNKTFTNVSGTYTTLKPGETLYLRLKLTKTVPEPSSVEDIGFKCLYKNLSSNYWRSAYLDMSSKRTPKIDFSFAFSKGTGISYLFNEL